MPKHRETIFVVIRTQYDEDSSEYLNPVSIAATQSLERAEELKGKYDQEMADRGLHDYFEFAVQTVTYYDE